MTRQEFGVLIKALKAIYTQESFMKDKYAMEIWFKMLEDMDYNVCSSAIQVYIMNNRFPPTPNDIRGIAMDITSDEEDWGKAWELAMSAVRRYGFYQQREALESLPPLTRATVERIGFGTLCDSDNPVADRAHFQRIYQDLAKRKRVMDILPITLQNKLTAIKEQQNSLESSERKLIE